MNNLDKVYNLSVDLKQSEHRYNSYAKFINDDVNTSILKIKLLNDNDYVNLEGCIVEAFFLLANNTKFNDTCEIVNAENGEIQINLPSECLVVGENYIYITVVKDGKESNAPIISYRVIKGITDNLPPVDGDPIQQTVKQLLLDVKVVQANQNDLQKRYEQAFPQIAKAIEDAKNATKRANEAIAAGTQDLEVKDARDGEATLKDRLERDLKLGKEIYEDVEGSFITVDNSVEASIQNIEILGNTVQNQSNLSDIKSVGAQITDGHYKMSILSCGKNLLSPTMLHNKEVISNTGELTVNNSDTWQSTDLIKICANKNYSFSKNEGTGDGYTYVYRYDTSKVFKGTSERIDLGTNKSSFSSTYDCYIRIATRKVGTDKLQLEEGTVATEYEPYKETKNTILLPCQLENGDRLYYDEVEKSWCIDKYARTIMPTDSVEWIMESGTSTDTCVRFRIKNNPYLTPMDSWIISSHFGSVRNSNGYNIEGVGTSSYNGYGIMIWIDKSKLSDLNSNGFNKWRNDNDFIIKFVTSTPQKIVLPLDTQIALNSFANRTHIYTLDTEIEPTIKAKVSKSLGASINSLVSKTNLLEDRIEAIEGLKESQDMQYSTDKGYLVCEETQSGVVKDLKIKGKTLVNKWATKQSDFISFAGIWNDDAKSVTITTKEGVTWSNAFTSLTSLIKPSTEYDIHVWVTENTLTGENKFKVGSWASKPNEVALARDFDIRAGVTGYFKYTVKSLETFTDETVIGLRSYLHNPKGVAGEKVTFKILIIEKDTPISGYFTGLQSVGKDVNKIEVLTRKEDGNLFDGELRDGVYDVSTGEYSSTTGVVCNTNKVFISNEGEFKISNPLDGGSYRIFFYGMSGNYISNVLIHSPYKFTPPKGTMYINFQISKTHFKDGIVINEFSSLNTNRETHKKEILYKDTDDTYKLVPALMEWDEIDDSKGKWYKRSEKVVLNGSESSWDTGTNQGVTTRFKLPISNIILKSDVICDRFNKEQAGTDKEGIDGHVSDKVIQITIANSKLETQDLAGFKKWLQANPVTVVYQLAQEEVYDIAPINLDAFANKTMVCCESGAISPHMSFAITSYIANLIQSNKERINKLEEKIFAEQELQNHMILENDLRLMDVEIAIMDFMPMEAKEKINLWRSNDMLREQTEFEFLKGRITSGSYTDDYLEKVINKYFKAGRLSQDEYDQLYDMIYPPVYNFMQ